MKFIRDNPGLTFTAVLIFALIGTMVVFLVSNSPGSPAGVSAPRVSETPTLRQAQGSALRVETLAPSATPSPAASLTPSVTPTTAPSATPTATPLVCTDEDREAIRAAVEKHQGYNKGLHYETNGAMPPGMYLVNMLTSGETRTDVMADGTELDLARIFYLTGKGELRWLWDVTGVVWTDGRYQPMNWRWTDCQQDDPTCSWLWDTREEAAELFTTPGWILDMTFMEWFVRPDAIHWENCGKPGQDIDKSICKLGLELELLSNGGSATFFQTEIAPQDWVAFWWMNVFSNYSGMVPEKRSIILPESAPVCR